MDGTPRLSQADHRKGPRRALGHLLEAQEAGHFASSQRPVPIGGALGRKLEVVRLGEVERPGPRQYVVEDLIPADYSTLWHGDGGVAKSIVALSLGVGVAGSSALWLGRAIKHGPVLYLDFELEAEEQARRVWQLCRAPD